MELEGQEEHIEERPVILGVITDKCFFVRPMPGTQRAKDNVQQPEYFSSMGLHFYEALKESLGKVNPDLLDSLKDSLGGHVAGVGFKTILRHDCHRFLDFAIRHEIRTVLDGKEFPAI
jgi:hypothetical protein